MSAQTPRALAKHQVEFSIDPGFGVETKVTCAGDSDSSCHRTCVKPGHDECSCWVEDDLTDYGKCVVAEWMNAEGPLEYAKGDGMHPLATLDIDVRWDSNADAWVWTPSGPTEPRRRAHKCGWCDDVASRRLAVTPDDANQPIVELHYCAKHLVPAISWSGLDKPAEANA